MYHSSKNCAVTLVHNYYTLHHVVEPSFYEHDFGSVFY